ncbi:class I SAM-dependent methyltransferase [Nonomuraea sp. NPDC052634]|uniref:class I SAM-dependent methyltransferase n=1 Tax=Nonomuraea sp. NPDC052634 TaxID=3155813 RepID=UPI0034219E1A
MRMTKGSLQDRVVAALVSQAHRPRGAFGWLEGALFAYRPSNRKRNRWAVSLLEVRPADRVLEVGFGPGVAIAELARRAVRGRVFGVDHSATMVRMAAWRNAAAVRAGRVRLVAASVERLPDFGGPLDVILAVNSVGFWPEPVDRLRELRGLLRPGGRIALVSQPRCPGASRETTVRAARELRDLRERAGFAGFRVETLELDPPVACVLAVNPGSSVS